MMLSIALIFGSLCTTVAAAANTVIDNLHANYDADSERVTVTGSVSPNEAVNVSVLVFRPDGQIEHVTQADSDAAGAFAIAFGVLKPIVGTYTVQVGATGALTKTQTRFVVPEEEDEEEEEPGGGGQTPEGGSQTPGTSTGSGGDSAYPGMNGNVLVQEPIVKEESGAIAAEASVARHVLEQLSQQAPDYEQGTKTIVLRINPIAEAESYQQTLPLDFFREHTDVQLIVETELGTLEIPNLFFAGADFADAGNITISIDRSVLSELYPAVRPGVGNRPVVDLQISLDSLPYTWHDSAAPITVTIPYTPSAAERGAEEYLIVRHVQGAEQTVMSSGHYSADKGGVVFRTDHFSQFAIAYNVRSFADIAGHWSQRNVEILASRGVINGISEDSYAPDRSIIRADFLVLLTKALELEAAVSSNFADVDANAYFYKAVGTARALGIATGVGDNLFLPRTEISRQEQMVLIARTLLRTGVLSVDGLSGQALDAFEDRDRIADYAKDSVALLVQAGIVQGSNGKINPTAPSTRAETASLIRRAYNLFHGLALTSGDQGAAIVFPEPSFHDSFAVDAGLDNWEKSKDGNGSLQNDRSFSEGGSYKAVINEQADIVRKALPDMTTGIVRMWLYDDAELTSNYSVGGRVDAGEAGKFSVIGVEAGFNKDHYAILAGPKWEATSVERATGWHELVWDYSSGTGLKMYIDGVLIKSTNEFSKFNQVAFGNFWPKEKGTATAYFDDVSIYGADASLDKVMGFPVYVADKPAMPSETEIGDQSAVKLPSLFHEGFEGKLQEGWTRSAPGAGRISSDQAFGGKQSIEIPVNAAVQVLTKRYDTPQNGIVSMQFYDDASITEHYSVGGRVDSNKTGMYSIIGVETLLSPDYYTVLAGPEWKVTGIARSTGWHEMIWDYSSGSHVDMYLDGKLIKSSNDFVSFTQIGLGNYWPKEAGSYSVYFDDIAVYARDIAVQAVVGYRIPEEELEQGASEETIQDTGLSQVIGAKVKVEFHADFEGALGTPWKLSQAGAAAVSNDRSHDGKKSVRVPIANKANTLTRIYAAPQQGIVSMWFYDDASFRSDYSVGGRVDTNQRNLYSIIGVETELNPDRYALLAGARWELTNIARSTGWHQLVWDYSSGSALDMYLDGRLIKSSADFTSFTQIGFGNYWPKANGKSAAYVDELKVYSADTAVRDVLVR